MRNALQRLAVLAVVFLPLVMLVRVDVQPAEASIPPGVMAELGHTEPGLAANLKAGNITFTCATNVGYNPDAGTGMIFGGSSNNPCLTGANTVTCENESAVPVYFVWREGTTAANYLSVAEKRCNVPATCPIGGGKFTTDVSTAIGNLFCLATGATQAISCHCSK